MITFEKLKSINVNDKTEKKEGLTYLSWAWAWGIFKESYPDATYEIIKTENGLPYFESNAGAMVYTKVTANNLTHEMWLPVMNGANKAMKSEPYSYQVRDWKTKQLTEKSVEAFTMFDVNKTLMRCLVKNLAMFGLALYIYAGEDLPEPEPVTQDDINEIIQKINRAESLDELMSIYKQAGNLDKASLATIKTHLSDRKLELGA